MNTPFDPRSAPEVMRFKTRSGEFVEGRTRCTVNGATLSPCFMLSVLLATQKNRCLWIALLASRTGEGRSEREALVIDTVDDGTGRVAALGFCPCCGTALELS